MFVPNSRDRRRRAARLVSVFAAVPALLVACSDSSAPAAPTAASVQATAGASQTATVGSAVATAPTVRVLSANGTAVPGSKVTFAVTAGGGKIEHTEATTGADGSASAGAWTLGTTAGANTLSATVAGLPAVQFTATGTAGAAAAMTIVAGDAQSAAVGTAVATAPAVALRDQYGNNVAGTAVQFSVATGNGTLTGAAATSGSDGVARVGGWTLGISAAAQTIKATAGPLSSTFTATGTVPAGCTVVNYALGATLPLNWESNDCTTGSARTDGSRYDRLQFTTTKQEIVDAQLTGATGRQLFLRRGTDFYVGRQPSAAFSPVTANPTRLKYILAPGTYVFEPSAPDATTTGAYTLSSTTDAKVDCDVIVFASTNVTFSGVVDNNSCVGPGNGREQWINLQLKTGTKVRITLSGTDNTPFLVFRDDRLGPASPTLATARGAAGETVVVNWTATFDTWHEIVVTSLNGLLGKYTLKIEELP